MKVVFVHGHKFRKVKDEIFSPGGLQEGVLDRYVEIFGNVTVIARIIIENSIATNYSKIINPNVSIMDNQDMDNVIKKSDAVIIRLPSVNGYKAVRIAQKYKKPYLIEVVACIWDAYWNHSVKGKCVALPAMAIMKKCVREAPYVVYVSQEFLQSRYPTRGLSVGISDVELVEIKDDILQSRKNKIKENKNKIIIGTAGAIDVRHKGQENVIKALKELNKDSQYEFEYQLVGAGSKNRLQEIACQNNVEKSVKFLGFMSHNDVFNWLDSIDVYIQPSFQEGLCRALVEAMSRGLPCVASAVGGNPELIDNRFIFSIRNRNNISHRIASNISKLTKDKSVMVNQAEQNFQHAQETFECNMLAEKRKKFYLNFKNEVLKCQK